MAIIVDCETLAIEGAEALTEPVSAPVNYKDPEKIAAYIAEKQRDQIEKAALYPYTSRIIALGYCYETDEVNRVEVINNEGREATVLREFWSAVVGPSGNVLPLVTFNGRAFDLPLLMVRSRLLGVPNAPELNVDRYRSPHPDLLDILTFRGALPARSLTWFATRFGLNTSDAFSGREIAQLYEDGNWDAIRSHCDSDVTLTRQLAERLGVVRRRPVVAAAGGPF
ncbi:MAG: ribonuclease H-like domain-containing protein [Candidatus Eisenbacteria bacterium]|nr:ribonuclease H-like domain-containing protein [Candidatus Eisenbacteria bacterium]